MTSILITVCGDICTSCLKSLVEGDPETFYPQLQQARQVACLFVPLDLNPDLHHWSHLESDCISWVSMDILLMVTHEHKTGYYICGYYNVRAVLKNMELLTCSFKFVWRVSGLRFVMELLESVC
jgi:uncharacterized protein YunC (DUF1805 family)